MSSLFGLWYKTGRLWIVRSMGHELRCFEVYVCVSVVCLFVTQSNLLIQLGDFHYICYESYAPGSHFINILSFICYSQQKQHGGNAPNRVKIHHWHSKSVTMFYKLEISNSIISHIFFIQIKSLNLPILVAARSKAWVCGRSLEEIVGSNTTRGINVCLLRVLCVVR